AATPPEAAGHHSPAGRAHRPPTAVGAPLRRTTAAPAGPSPPSTRRASPTATAPPRPPARRGAAHRLPSQWRRPPPCAPPAAPPPPARPRRPRSGRRADRALQVTSRRFPWLLSGIDARLADYRDKALEPAGRGAESDAGCRPASWQAGRRGALMVRG